LCAICVWNLTPFSEALATRTHATRTPTSSQHTAPPAKRKIQQECSCWI